MPGSYRSLASIQKAKVAQPVKVEEVHVEEAEVSSVEEKGEVFDGKWTASQNFQFAIFVNYYENIFASKRKRKICKIFKSLSEFLSNRTPTQCRSHFQKMMAKHKSIARIKKYYRTLAGNEVYLKELQQFRSQWQQNHQPMEVLYPEIKETKEYAAQTDPPEPSTEICADCRVREEGVVQNMSPNVPLQMNPWMFWNNNNQMYQVNQANLMLWIQANIQAGNPYL